MSEAALRRQLEGRLRPVEAPEPVPREFSAAVAGDHVLNPSGPTPAGVLSAAAVLVPIVAHPEPTVLLTRRTETLTKHSGQVSFPGGRVEESDRDAADCALRETEEEIGLHRSHVRVLGALDPYITVTGYAVTPVVGIVMPGFSLTIDPREVAEVFEVPFGFLLDERNHQRHSGTFNGRERHWWAMPYRDHYIWGATAGMIRNLVQRLKD